MPLWAAFALLFVSYAITAIMVKPPKPSEPAGLEEFDFPQDAEGTPKGVVFGDVWLDGWFVISFGNLRTKAIKSKSGKK